MLVGGERAQGEHGQHEPVEHLAVQVDVVPDHVRMQRRDEGGNEAHACRAKARPDLEDDERGRDRDDHLCDAHGEPVATERVVQAREEPSVQRLRVRRRDVGQEAERPVVDEGRREAVALVDELLEDRLALSHEHEEARDRGGGHDDECARRPFHLASSTMGATTGERYAVVSCHVERPLDGAVWTRFAALQDARPGGFVIAALMRPPDPDFGEDHARWLERARAASMRGPLGHHTHWTAPDHARPTSDATGARVRDERARLGGLELPPTLFCGGGWYTDAEVAEACSDLDYVDCTPRATRPLYLAQNERWASLAEPATVELPSGRELRVIPTTHSLGDLARALTRRALPQLVHVYFHDTDLLDWRRRGLLRATLPLLARRANVTDLDTLATHAFAAAPRVPWADVARI